MTSDLTIKSFIRTGYNNAYAIAFIAIVVLSAVLFCFDMLAAYDPAVLSIPEWWAKTVYAVGGIAGIVVYVGMILGYITFKWNKPLAKYALITEITGLAFHILALITLSLSTLTAGLDSLWLTPTTIFLALPHMQFLSNLVRELARVEFKRDQRHTVARLVGE